MDNRTIEQIRDNETKLIKELQQKENIIKEVREYINEQLSQGGEREIRDLVDGYGVLEILDRDKNEINKT